MNNSIESINKEKTVFKNSDINYGSTGITHEGTSSLCKNNWTN